jgi:double-stranded uracil-DNA glycosylase
MRVKYGLKPIIDRKTRILVLGSFPSEKALEKKEYYGNPRNQFWSIMSDLLGIELISKTYSGKVRALLQNRIGLCDIISSCKRAGSSDAAISNEKLNDINEILNRYPGIKAIAVNGIKAKKLLEAYKNIDADTLFMPSTSPAHATMPYKDKKNEWERLLRFL